MTAREHVVAAYRHLEQALERTASESYQRHREPMVPLGAIRSCLAILRTYSTNPIQR